MTQKLPEIGDVLVLHYQDWTYHCLVSHEPGNKLGLTILFGPAAGELLGLHRKRTFDSATMLRNMIQQYCDDWAQSTISPGDINGSFHL